MSTEQEISRRLIVSDELCNGREFTSFVSDDHIGSRTLNIVVSLKFYKEFRLACPNVCDGALLFVLEERIDKS